MSRANKTTRISTGGYYPPRGLSMEPHEEERHEQEFDSPTPIPTLESFQEELEEEEPEEVEVVVLSNDDEEEEAVQEDELIPPLG